jgi:hypothetical protein
MITYHIYYCYANHIYYYLTIVVRLSYILLYIYMLLSFIINVCAGYFQDYEVERYVRDIKVDQILEGTNEIIGILSLPDLSIILPN